MMVLPLTKMGKWWQGRTWCAWAISGALFGQDTFEKPARHLRGDTWEAGGYSGTELGRRLGIRIMKVDEVT